MPSNPLLIQARRAGNPVVEGETATFFWQGSRPVLLVDDAHGWEEAPCPLKRSAPQLWTTTLRLKPDAYVEYAFLDPSSGERLPDPLNPQRVWNGMHAYNHYFYMPRGRPTGLIQPVKAALRGQVSRHSLPTRELAAGERRTVYLYRPPVSGRVPLLVVFDGPDYLQRGRLNHIVDNLIHQARIQPIGMALLAGGGPARNLEYSCADATLGFLQECVLPLAHQELDLLPGSSSTYGVLGASLGGLMALYTGMRAPAVFKRVLSQSGAFFLPDFEFVVVDLVRNSPPADLDIWMDAGRYEWLLEGNRRMARLLRQKGYSPSFRVFPGGHNYSAWRDDLGRGLERLFA